jgi:hypothetical protein
MVGIRCKWLPFGDCGTGLGRQVMRDLQGPEILGSRTDHDYLRLEAMKVLRLHRLATTNRRVTTRCCRSSRRQDRPLQTARRFSTFGTTCARPVVQVCLGRSAMWRQVQRLEHPHPATSSHRLSIGLLTAQTESGYRRPSALSWSDSIPV